MSSTVYIKLKDKIDRKEFDNFAKENDIVFSPMTIGGNVYYNNDTEIIFYNENWCDICCSTYWMGNLSNVIRVVKLIKKQ